MISIRIHLSNGEKPFLKLKPGTRLSLELISPAFDFDLDKGETSLPINLPWVGNRQFLGSPEMIESSNKQPWFTVDVLFKNSLELSEAKLTIIQCKGDLSYGDGDYICSISGGESRFGTLIKNKTLKDLSLCGLVSWASIIDSRTFAETLMKSGNNQYPFVFAPVSDFKYFDESRDDYNNEFIVNQTINNIQYSTAFSSGWSFARPDPLNPTLKLSPGNAGYNDYRTIPFFQLQYVFKRIFNEHGYQVVGDWFEHPDFQCVYLWNNYSLETPTAGNYDVNTFLLPSNHMPKKKLGYFLQQVSKFFGFGIYLESDGMFRIRYRTDCLKPVVVKDISKYVQTSFTSKKLPLADGGIRLNFKYENDNRASDLVQEIDQSKVRAEVELVSDIATLSLTPVAASGDLVYVRALNYYYVFNGTNWNAFSEGNQEIILGDGKESFEIEATPLVYDIDRDMSACDQVGSYANKNGLRINSDFEIRFFYVKSINKGTATNVPSTFTHNKRPNGSLVADVSLSLKAIGSIYQKFHQPFFEKLSNSDLVTVSLIVNSGIDIKSFEGLMIKNVQYILYKITKDISNDKSMEMDLIPI